ncbi:MAG: arylsulfatase [Planctomycetaceae bacterium]|jgi:arylsulfatase A|nr:arylsulfatase [Planctomycetaceae bacterium]MBT6155089.1 arylsulfatase [Planctomycetaceae bacterium]MBT6483395.1 arylsulfatase [Planctomycetaceae bacterium]MBT6493810.1 arylsulfatase [Planctomycetaceae bacterium]
MRILLTSLLVLASFATSLEFTRAAERRPNVIYLLADDLGYSELGCYGQKWIKTPNIDRIAKQGIRFTNHYSGNAVCAPSRCCLLTGKHPGHAYIRSNGNPKDLQTLKEKYGWEFPGQFPIPKSEFTIGEMLQAHGYATAAIGKWGLGHFGTTGDPNRQGFDLFYGFNCQVHAHNHYPKFLWRNDKKEILPGNDRTLYGKTFSQDKFTETALEFIRANKDRPFFLYVPFAIPHLSIQVTEKSLAEYKGKIPEADYKHRGYLKHPFPRAGYAAMISHLDRDVGKITELVKELGLDDNTLVVFSSDNGPTYNRLGGSDSDFFESAGPFRGLKGSLYEGGIRVPLVARWPGKIKAGTTSDHPSAFWDVMPTIAEVAGIEAPSGIDGVSFAPTLLGQTDRQKKHDYLYWEFPSYGGQQVVRVGDWKGVRQGLQRKNNPNRLKVELYNLKTDPGEANDVAAKHPDLIAKIERVMRDARVPSKLFPVPVLDEE